MECTKAIHWTTDWQNAFEELWHCLLTAPVLTHPDFTYTFIVDTNASNTGIEAAPSAENTCTYQKVQEQMGHKLDRQKELYDKKVHGKLFETGDFVLLLMWFLVGVLGSCINLGQAPSKLWILFLMLLLHPECPRHRLVVHSNCVLQTCVFVIRNFLPTTKSLSTTRHNLLKLSTDCWNWSTPY